MNSAGRDPVPRVHDASIRHLEGSTHSPLCDVKIVDLFEDPFTRTA